MDKCIKWYKRISMLSLFLFMFGILLINICIIGLSLGSDNIAFAAQNNGTYWNNLITNPEGSTWDFNASSSNNATETVFFNDGSFKYSLYGFGSVSNNVFTASGGSLTFRVSKVGSSVSMSSRNWYAVGYTVSQSGSVSYNWYIQNNPQTSQTLSMSYPFVSNGTTTSYTLSNNYAIFNFSIPDGVSLTINWLCLLSGTNVTAFPGYVPNSYSPNGYDIGFTDGVNSAGGGTITGVNDLTDLTWEVPDSVTEQLSVSSVDYSVTGYAVRVDGDNSYTYNFTTLNLTNDLTFTNLVSAIYYKATGFSRAANSSDLIYFTGGTDVTNTDLIQWLEDNNTFKTYTEGYQDGYNQGHDIGYQEGYDKAMSLVNNFSSIYNIIGGFIYNTNFGSTVTDDLGGEGIQVTVPADYGSGYGYDSISGTIGYSSGHINIYTTSQKPSYLLASNLNPYGTYFYLYDPTDLSANINTSQLYINICPSGSSQSVRLLPLHNDLIINNCYAMNLSGLYGGNYDVYICMQVTGSTMYLTLSNTWNTGVGIGGLYQHLGDEGSYSLGYTDGYSSGYDYGMDLGYDVGYRAGQDDTNPYSFYDLFGAIYDVPVRTFNGMFDLNILGINLKGFILGLISLCIVLFILKIVFK